MSQYFFLFGKTSHLPAVALPCIKGNHYGVHGLQKEAVMSQRHRNQDLAPVPRADIRDHAHNERHRIHSKLHLAEEAMRHGLEPIDLEEPAPNWKGVHHRDAAHSTKRRRTPLKHWKTKDWKRRKAIRRQRAIQWNMLG